MKCGSNEDIWLLNLFSVNISGCDGDSITFYSKTLCFTQGPKKTGTYDYFLFLKT